MGTRIVLLASLAWIIGLTQPVVEIFDHGFSGRDLILILGGLFLLWKATNEIHEKLEGEEADEGRSGTGATFVGVVVQIGILDMVFSLDSVITAVGLADELGVMVVAIVLAVLVMMAAANGIGEFVGRHPTVKMLALSFLLLIGMSLVADRMGLHIPKAYIYFAMGLSVFVEMLNLQLRASRRGPVKLRGGSPNVPVK